MRKTKVYSSQSVPLASRSIWTGTTAHATGSEPLSDGTEVHGKTLQPVPLEGIAERKMQM